jgi:ATP-dependent DNA helicase RecQ
MAKLSDMYSYCTGGTCRHRVLLQYFGQDLDKPDCAACDICLGELDYLENSLETAQKILSCIVRLGERFGGSYTALVLTGSREQRILENRHDELTTYGLLSDQSRHAVHDWIEQLVGQGYVAKVGEYNVLKLTETGWRVLRAAETPRLLKPVRKPAKVSKVARDSWEGVDEGLFDALRELRRGLASRKGIPAYLVFGDRTLRELARRRPSTPDALLEISGVGEKKRRQYGQIVLNAITQFCRTHALDTDL